MSACARHGMNSGPSGACLWLDAVHHRKRPANQPIPSKITRQIDLGQLKKSPAPFRRPGEGQSRRNDVATHRTRFRRQREGYRRFIYGEGIRRYLSHEKADTRSERNMVSVPSE